MNTVAEYQYDGLNRRIVTKLFAGGSFDHDEHFYLSEANQVLEIRKDASANAHKQFTWGSRYLDDLILRTRDLDDNGSIDETLFAIQDANWDVTALADTSGAVQERFRYDPYGRSLVMDEDFGIDPDGKSDYDWEYRFTSREYDTETGLHYFRARYWHPDLGRFIGRDPLEYVDGYSLYAGYFVPSGVDPSGMDWLDCMNACMKDNDPIDQALTAAIAALAAQPIPKSLVAAIADAVGDKQLANAIRGSLKAGGSRLTTLPSSLSAKLRAGGRSSLRMLGRKASATVGPILVAYGLALAAVEAHCAGTCTACSIYGVDYDSSMGIGPSAGSYF